ncbi:hypothetical protein ENBRE01_1285 [Enteropsectra breve]|nr:hypothetical protein ENBRE01_1285 [Enteropsectra breve]
MNDDLTSWLKIAAENKITSKNTWKSTLIEHFSNISKFKENKGINFNKASCALDGCIKVYSTRVDDVTDSTTKLMDIFSRHDEHPESKRADKKRQSFIDKEGTSINLKESCASKYYDSVFDCITQQKNNHFLCLLLKPSSRGLLLYHSLENELVMDDETVQLEIRELPISASLESIEEKDMAPAEQHDTIEMSTVYQSMQDDARSEDMEDDDVEQEDCTDKKEAATYIFQETPFGYFKGWAGPQHWRVSTKKQEHDVVKRPRESFLLDFYQEMGSNTLFETSASTLMSKELIVSRRQNKNTLPEDFSFERLDLYKMNRLEASFQGQAEKSHTPVEIETTCGEMQDACGDEHVDEASVDLSFQLENSLKLDESPSPSIALRPIQKNKKVDVVLLKNNVYSLLCKSETLFTELYKNLEKCYSSEEYKDISVHLVLIVLLHISNEKNILIVNEKNDLIIRHKICE